MCGTIGSTLKEDTVKQTHGKGYKFLAEPVQKHESQRRKQNTIRRNEISSAS